MPKMRSGLDIQEETPAHTPVQKTPRRIAALTAARSAKAALLIMLLSACGAPAPTPTAPTSGATTTATPPTTPSRADTKTAAPTATQGAAETARSSDPFAVTGTIREETLLIEPQTAPANLKLPPTPGDLRPEPAACGAMAKRKPAPAPACADKATALAALEAALSEPDGDKRDAKLAGLEGCAGLPTGVARALRLEISDFTPSDKVVECGEALAEPLLASPPRGLSGPVHLALFGHALASRAKRHNLKMPELKSGPGSTKDDVLGFVRTRASDWAKSRQAELEEIDKVTLAMPASYGRAVAAAAVGRAFMKAAATMRAAPIPAWMKSKDQSALRGAYYDGLSSVGAPLKDRGRRALLLSQRDFEALGALRDDRARLFPLMTLVDRPSRALGIYEGAEDSVVLASYLEPPSRSARPAGPSMGEPSPRPWRLQLPKLEGATPKTIEERLAILLPTFYAGLLLDASLAKEPSFLRALLARGIPAPHRSALKGASLSPEAARLYAYGQMLLGIRWMSAAHFDQAAALASSAAKSKDGREGEAGFVLAMAIALRNGPANLDAWMALGEEPSPSGLGDVSALEALAQRDPKGPHAWRAHYNAALIREYTAAPSDAKDKGVHIAFYREQSRRYREAVALLPKEAQSEVILQADGAEATARFLEGSGAKPGSFPAAVEVNGVLPRPVIESIVRSEANRLQPCMEEAKKSDPSAKWRIAVRFLIDHQGFARYAEAPIDTLANEPARACVLRAFSGMRFQYPTTGVTSVLYPIDASAPL